VSIESLPGASAPCIVCSVYFHVKLSLRGMQIVVPFIPIVVEAYLTARFSGVVRHVS
jgi:hypothetical protein